MAPARILARELQHKRPDLCRQRRPPALTSPLSQLPAYERLMPAQQRPRRNQEHADRRPRQVTGRGCQQGPISCAKLRPGDLATQNLQLMPEHQQLDVFHMQATAATNERAKQGPNGEVEEGEDHVAHPPNPPRTGEATRILAPFTPAWGALSGRIERLHD
jgi:hypothetical protein